MNGNWNWTDGSRSIYTNWGKDFEDNNPRHDCVYVDREEGKWRDENCTKEMSFLCKMKTDCKFLELFKMLVKFQSNYMSWGQSFVYIFASF